MDQQTEARNLETLRRDLLATHGPRHGAESVETALDAALDSYRDAHVRDYIPVLVARQVRRQLTSEPHHAT
jgi:hypothetical protein